MQLMSFCLFEQGVGKQDTDCQTYMLPSAWDGHKAG